MGHVQWVFPNGCACALLRFFVTGEGFSLGILPNGR
jgi:hypothetical protein